MIRKKRLPMSFIDKLKPQKNTNSAQTVTKEEFDESTFYGKVMTIRNQIKIMWSESHAKVILIFALTTFVCFYLIGLFAQVGQVDELMYDPFSALVSLVYFPNRIIMLLLAVMLSIYANYSIMIWIRRLTKDYYIDERTNTKVAKDDGTEGTAHWMTDEEAPDFFNMDRDAKKLEGTILGYKADRDKNGKQLDTGVIYARKAERRFTNENYGIFGPPGIGKSICMVNNDVLQAIWTKQSIIVIDTKGTVYKDTAYVAEQAGYGKDQIRIFDIKPDEVKHSDGCDLLKTIPSIEQIEKAKPEEQEDLKNLARSATKTVVDTIMANLYSDKEKGSVWYKSAYNLFMSAILVIKMSKKNRWEKTLAGVYDMLIELGNWGEYETTWDKMIEGHRDHVAYDSYKIFKGTVPAVKDSAYGDLCTDLNFMANTYIKKIISTDEIDLTLPGQKPCVYYIVMSDNDPTNNLLAALFIEQLFRGLVSYADNQKVGGELRLPVPVIFEIDEFKNIGRIPMFVEKLSTVRSRGIKIKWVLQDKSQLDQMFPNGESETVISDCTSIIILGIGNSTQTAKYFSERLGKYTIRKQSKTTGKNQGNILRLPSDDYKEAESGGSRCLMTPDELQGNGKYGLKSTELLLITHQGAPIILDKFMWWNHPLYKELNLSDPSTKRFTTDHIPEWRKKLIAEGQNIPDNDNDTPEEPNAEGNQTDNAPSQKGGFHMTPNNDGSPTRVKSGKTKTEKVTDW